jgi:aminoglycoside 3-N-acetyltransferase I
MSKMISIDQVKIERLKKGDLARFIELVRLFGVVFEIKNFSIPDSGYLKSVLSRSDFFVFAAMLEGKVVGGLTTYVLMQYYSNKPLAYIYDLAVDANLQRQGIGKKLILATNQFYKEKGFEEVFVQADKVDEHAIDFYRSTKPTEEEQVVHFYYTLNK